MSTCGEPTTRRSDVIPAWLWESLLLMVTLATAVALALIGALAAGWNSPRPGCPPSWQDSGLPARVEVMRDATMVRLPGRSETHFTFEVTAAPLSRSKSGLQEYGLVYRAQDAAHYYAFVIASDGYYSVMRAEGGDLSPLAGWEQFPHVARGPQVNRLLVTCTGPTCSFRVNDEHVTTIKDDRWIAGDVGLWARSLNARAVLEFSTARLWTSAEGECQSSLWPLSK